MSDEKHHEWTPEEAMLALRINHFVTVAAFFEDSLKRVGEEKSQLWQLRNARKSDNAFSEIIWGVDFVINVPNLFRRALFISAYSLLEHHLDLLAEEYQKRMKLTVSLQDIHGKGIERARTYLKKVAGVPFPDTSNEWQVLKRLAQLRNLLVHSFGRAEAMGKDKDLVNWLTNTQHAECASWAGGAVFLQPSFIEFVLQNIVGLFRKLGYTLALDEEIS